MIGLYNKFIIGFLALIFLLFSAFMAKVEVNDDITQYNKYIGEEALEEYKNKWGMDETIFPKEIKDNMNVYDYKMVYYNPWDAQFLSYVVVEYNNKDYKEEVKRLNSYSSTEYIGYYGVTGFSKYKLLAMYADPYNGFVYALTDEQNKIIYVELIFCNYSFDIEYEEYIEKEYLPDGFDATIDNKYQKEKLKY